MVIACDGVWDVMTSEQVMQYVYDQFNSWRDGSDNGLYSSVQSVEETAAAICDNLLLQCLEKGSTDNMSLVLVLFPAFAAARSYNGSRTTTPRTVLTGERGEKIEGTYYDTPDCIASPSPLYLPGTLSEEEQQHDTNASGAEELGKSEPSPIKATKLF